MQRTLGAAFIALAGMSTTAYAADIYAGSLKDTPVDYEAAPAPIWSGLYVGGHIGGLWNDSGNTELSKRRKDKKRCVRTMVRI
jgi:outer membrane immunogenic protein